MKHLFILPALVFAAFVGVKAQPSFSVNFGSNIAEPGDDPYGINNPWVPTSGNNTSTEDGLKFFSGGSSTTIKLNAMWEVSEIFSAGIAYKMMSWKMDKNFRTSDMSSLGVQFRINFVGNTKRVVPFFQGTYYPINNTTMTQQQATSGSQTQPAFTLSQSTSLGFDADLGLEVKIGKSWAALLTGGFSGTQATDSGLTINYDYTPYVAPKHIDGVFSYAFSAGIKYYTGRGVKKRDF